jgi:predicted O-methyltransferase YrrM
MLSKETENLTLISSTEEENKVIDRLDPSYKRVNSMSDQDRYFLNTMLLRSKPKKVLELGVAAGGSSVVMLNALKSIGQTRLYSIDCLPYWYREPDKASGFIVDNYPDLRENWKMYSGGMATKFIDEIGGGIDFILIDTLHCNPGEIFDFLMILPFLDDNATIVFHDTKLHTHMYFSYYTGWHITNCILMSSIHGEKFIPEYLSASMGWDEEEAYNFPNIGAVKLNKQTRNRLFEVINLLTIRWAYLPSENDRIEIIGHLSKYYDPLVVKYISDVFEFQNLHFAEYREKERELFNAEIQCTWKEKENEINRIRNSRSYRIGRLITWLPRKMRDLFR